MPAFAAALHSAANGPLSMATGSGAVGNPTSLLSANLMKHALSSSSSSGPTASSSTLTRHNTFPVRPSQLTAADHHHEQDMKRMKSLSAFEAATASSSASHMQHSTPIANKTPLSSSSSSSSQSRTTRATSNSLETPRNNPNISPQSWSIAQAFYRLGDEFAAKQQRNGSLLLTDEQRKAIRLSMSSSISTEGREAIAESVLRTLRFSAENFFQQFSETTPEAAQAEKVAIADNNSNNSSSSSCNDPTTTRRASAYTAAAGSSSTRSMLMDVDEIDDTPAAAAKAAPVAPSTQKKQKANHHHHHNSLTEEDEEEEEENTTEIVAQRARALSEASAKENTDPSSVTQTASAMREIQVTDYKASPFAGKHPHHQSKRLVHRKGSRTATTTATTHEQHQNKRRRRNSTGSRHSAHDDSETEAEDDDNLSDDGERLRRRADSMNDDDDKNDDDNDDDASTEDERDNDFDGEGEDRERRYLKKMAAKQRAVQAALDAAAMTMPPVAVSE